MFGYVDHFLPKEVNIVGNSMQWVSLIAGAVIFVYGITKLFSDHDGIPFILGLLIIGFSVSKMIKIKGGKGSSHQKKGL
jgi:hypothetical protein